MPVALPAFILSTALTTAARSAVAFIGLRLVAGLSASGIVPLALALVGDLYPYRERGRALGWLFGAMAGGMAFGSTAGALLKPLVGWQGLFLGVAGLCAVVAVALWPFRALLGGRATELPKTAWRES